MKRGEQYFNFQTLRVQPAKQNVNIHENDHVTYITLKKNGNID